MMTDAQKTIECIEKNEQFALILPPKYTIDTAAAAEVLLRFLEIKGKRVGTIGMLEKENFKHAAFFPKLFALAPLPKEFIVSLDTARSPLSQLRYEERDGGVDIILSPKSLPITESYVSFRDGKHQCDCAILVGVENIDMLGNTIAAAPSFFTETTLINIDVSPQNAGFGETNLIDTKRLALSELMYEFVTLVHEEPLDGSSATLLLSGIMEQSNFFASAGVSAETMRVASELMRLGGNFTEARTLTYKTRPVELVQLAGRAATRSRLDEGNGILWSFITKDDFEKTKRTPDDIAYVLEGLASTFPPHRITSLLWHDPHTGLIKSILSGEKRILATIEEHGRGSFQSPHLLLNAVFPSFKDAEEEISSLLRTVL